MVTFNEIFRIYPSLIETSRNFLGADSRRTPTVGAIERNLFLAKMCIALLGIVVLPWLVPLDTRSAVGIRLRLGAYTFKLTFQIYTLSLCIIFLYYFKLLKTSNNIL